MPAPSSSHDGSNLLASIAPIAAFLVANRLGGLRLAVACATVTALAVAAQRRRHGLAIGRLMPLATAAIVFRGVVGIATNSEGWYFGIGIAAKFAAAGALALSFLLRRPAADPALASVTGIAPAIRQHPRWMSTMALLTVIASVYFAATATIDVWLFRRNSVEGFVLLRFLTNWPLGVAAIALGAAVCARRLPTIPGMPPLADLVASAVDTDQTSTTDHSTTDQSTD